jgi:hypothetical protein
MSIERNYSIIIINSKEPRAIFFKAPLKRLEINPIKAV